MADCATTCRAGVTPVAGRAITRIPVAKATTNQVFKTEPKFNDQPSTAAIDAKYTNRFDDVGYYFQIPT